MVGVGCACDAKICQYEGGAEFGHEFLGGIRPGAEPAGEVAGEAVRGAGPVYELVRESAGVASRRAEDGAGRQVDRVGGRHVAGAVAAMLDSGAGGGDERVEGGQRI